MGIYHLVISNPIPRVSYPQLETVLKAKKSSTVNRHHHLKVADTFSTFRLANQKVGSPFNFAADRAKKIVLRFAATLVLTGVNPWAAIHIAVA